ncbi:MAG TPA: glycerol-3-phosphate acyltransferase [Candidatus Kapabacteria bacterium]|jgi:glycerol-3-phosphate acyltransferase PlsY
MLSLHAILLGGIVGYLCGSIPSAYLITRWKTGRDLRREGSRNIGARNAFEVTGDKTIGTLVLAADLLKAVIPVHVFEYHHWTAALLVLIPSLVLGHCYPISLRFHGGRGLATAAGAMLLLNPIAILLWLFIYLLTNKLTRQVHFSSVIACGAALLAVMALPKNFLSAITLSFSGLDGMIPTLRISLGVMVLIILSRHVEPMWALLRGKDST